MVFVNIADGSRIAFEVKEADGESEVRSATASRRWSSHQRRIVLRQGRAHAAPQRELETRAVPASL